MQESANVDRPTEYGIRYGISEFKQGTIGGGNKARYQILRKTLSLLSAASGSVILKVLEVPPTSYRASKLNGVLWHVFTMFSPAH